jgi:tRNA uridine 5-carbamoylmethylation protein Kti12
MKTLRLIMTKGLPASGKSTFAKELIAKEPGKWKRINKDLLREMFDGGKWSRENEKFILNMRDCLIAQAFNSGFSVIIDDTNLHETHELRLKALAKGALINGITVNFEVKDFTDVPVEVCIDRDYDRAIGKVGKKVIMGMYHQFLAPKLKPLEFTPGLPTAIVCDIDGTLALFEGENPYDRDFSQDRLNEPVANILRQYKNTTKIIIVSGRKEKYIDQTEKWLLKNNIEYDFLYLPRGDADNRKDFILKKELYDACIKGKYNVLLVIDDRKQVKKMWVANGLFVLDVNQTDEEF